MSREFKTYDEFDEYRRMLVKIRHWSARITLLPRLVVRTSLALDVGVPARAAARVDFADVDAETPAFGVIGGAP